jgi:hypothetical protein
MLQKKPRWLYQQQQHTWRGTEHVHSYQSRMSLRNRKKRHGRQEKRHGRQEKRHGGQGLTTVVVRESGKEEIGLLQVQVCKRLCLCASLCSQLVLTLGKIVLRLGMPYEPNPLASVCDREGGEHGLSSRLRAGLACHLEFYQWDRDKSRNIISLREK